jgi:hypothetical protein
MNLSKESLESILYCVLDHLGQVEISFEELAQAKRDQEIVIERYPEERTWVISLRPYREPTDAEQKSAAIRRDLHAG